MKCVSVNADYMQRFVIINIAGIMINADANTNNWIKKVYVTKDLFGILVIVPVNMINHVMLVSIGTMKIGSTEKNRW